MSHQCSNCGGLSVHLLPHGLFFFVGVRPSSSGDSCQPVTSAIPGCKELDPVPVDSSKFYFIFSKCYTPVVNELIYTKVNPHLERSVTTSTELTITGSGFTVEPCSIEVTIGEEDDVCLCMTLASPTVSKFKCQPDSNCANPIGVLREVSVRIGNRGKALMANKKYDRSVAFVPLITSLTPNSGSEVGGTVVVITGTGLQHVTSVTFKDFAADFTVQDDTTIHCTSPRSATGPVIVSKDQFSSTCTSGSSSCTFHYYAIKTPKVKNIDPSSVNSDAGVSLTITGEKFGNNPSDIEVSISGEECGNVAIETEDTVITCTVGGLPAGENMIDLIVAGKGKASSTVTVTGIPVLDAPTPAAGSINGGTVLVLTGHGFHVEGTMVSLDGNPCELKEDENVTLSRVVCITPSHGVGTVNVNVDANGNSFDAVSFVYSLDATPEVTDESVDPKIGVAGESITIPGAKFGNVPSNVRVEVGGAECTVDTCTDNEITCTLGSHSSGTVQGSVYVKDLGLSNSFEFTYTIKLTSVTPSSG